MEGLVASWRLLLVVDSVVRRMRGVSQLFQDGSFPTNRLESFIYLFCFELSISFYSVNSISLGRASYYLLAFPRYVMLVHS
jgi:hypothetical protein